MKIKGVMFVCFCNHVLGQIVRGMDKSYVIRQSRVVDMSLAGYNLDDNGVDR